MLARLEPQAEWTEKEFEPGTVPDFMVDSGWLLPRDGVFVIRMRVQSTDVGFVAIPLARALRGFTDEERAKQMSAYEEQSQRHHRRMAEAAAAIEKQQAEAAAALRKAS